MKKKGSLHQYIKSGFSYWSFSHFLNISASVISSNSAQIHMILDAFHAIANNPQSALPDCICTSMYWSLIAGSLVAKILATALCYDSNNGSTYCQIYSQ